jgi:hypothetical protein
VESSQGQRLGLPGRDNDFIGWNFMGALYVLCGKYFSIPLQSGKGQNSIPARDLESHNLGRKCGQN